MKLHDAIFRDVSLRADRVAIITRKYSVTPPPFTLRSYTLHYYLEDFDWLCERRDQVCGLWGVVLLCRPAQKRLLGASWRK